MRFRHRRKVDFPHPDGPMTAITVFALTTRSTSFTACVARKKAKSFST
jgi:hypothetical protein